MGEGKLYQKMMQIDKEFNEKMDDLSFTDLKPVLDEVKADLEEQLNNNLGESEELTIYHRWYDKWFGSK